MLISAICALCTCVPVFTVYQLVLVLVLIYIRMYKCTGEKLMADKKSVLSPNNSDSTY